MWIYELRLEMIIITKQLFNRITVCFKLQFGVFARVLYTAHLAKT